MISPARFVPSVRVVALLAVAAVSLAACRKKPAPAPLPTTSGVNTDSINAARAREDSLARARAREEFVRDSTARASADRAARLAGARAALTATVFFDYDQAEIRDDARAALDAKLPVLLANPGVRLRVAGHTDSRGSDEYNLALGARRAASVKTWLTERGIDAGRLEIVSFGEERGTCTAEDEACWAQNRRAEFELTAGGDPLTLPNDGR